MMMKRFIACCTAIACTMGAVTTCLAAEAEIPIASVQTNSFAVASKNGGRSYTYSTAEKDAYNFARIKLSGTTIQVERRGHRAPSNPDTISIRLGGTTVMAWNAKWGDGAVEGTYYGYNAMLDASALGDGTYTIVLESETYTIVEDPSAGETVRYANPYTLTSVPMVKQGGVCYFPADNSISSRYNTSLLQQLQQGNAPDDFTVLKTQYEKAENAQVLNKIEAKTKEVTAGLTSDTDKCMAVYQWIVNNISYDFDLTREDIDGWIASHPEDAPRVDDPLYAFENGYAMCYGYAKLTTLMLGYAGVDSVYVKGLYDTDVSASVGSAVNPDEFNHAWNAVKISGSWYFVDTCKDSVYGYYRKDKTKPSTSYLTLNKLQAYVYIFPSLSQISNTHIAIRYGAEKYGTKLNDIGISG